MPRSEEASIRHARHYADVVHRINDLYLSQEDSFNQALNQLDQDWSNIVLGRQWAESQLGQNRNAAELCNDYPDTLTALLTLRLPPHE
jgi:hypothetical protein